MKAGYYVITGEHTAQRKWVQYEIKKSWDSGKGVLGIHIHNLEDSEGGQANIAETLSKTSQ